MNALEVQVYSEKLKNGIIEKELEKFPFSLLDLQYEESTGLVSDNELEVSIDSILHPIKGTPL